MEVLAFRAAGRPTGRLIGQGLGLPFGSCAFHTRTKGAWEIAIRWGGVESPERETPRTLNRAEGIRAASGKFGSFRRFRDSDVPIPRFTTSVHEAREWGTVVYGRTNHGFQGRGICVYQPGAECGPHELYVEGIPCEREYRLHVVKGMVVSVQRKYLERPHLDDGGFVKNLAHGYVFKTPQRGLNGSRHSAAIKAVECLGLDFGAVDMVIDAEGREYVLEVNTAPALSPMRVEKYVAALREARA